MTLMTKDFEALKRMTEKERYRLFPVRLVAYNKAWGERFLTERSLILRVAEASNIKSINHIGSTAIPGIKSKLVIDILLEVVKGINLQELKENMLLIGYGASERHDMPMPHLSFLKGYSLKGYRGQPFHVHIRYEGEKRSDFDEIYFKDFLIEHKEIAKEYESLKIRMQREFEYDRDAYSVSKTEFVTRITRLARRSKS